MLLYLPLATRARVSDKLNILDLIIINDNFMSEINHLSPLGKWDHAILGYECAFNI